MPEIFAIGDPPIKRLQTSIKEIKPHFTHPEFMNYIVYIHITSGLYFQ